MKPVRFLRDFAPYAAGEIAGFEEAKVEDLIRRGFAVAHVVEDEEAEEEPVVSDEDEDGDDEEAVPARRRRRRS